MAAESLILRPYQDGMTQFALDTPNCALWAEPGLGKTPVALSVMTHSLFDAMDTSRWLVVAPKLVASDDWPRQLRKWMQFRHLTWRNLTPLIADIYRAARTLQKDSAEVAREGILRSTISRPTRRPPCKSGKS